MALDGAEDGLLDFRLLRHASCYEIDADIVSDGSLLEMCLGLIEEACVVGREIGESRERAERHGMRSVATRGTRGEWCALSFLVAGLGILDGTAGFQIDGAGPGDRSVGLCGKQFTGGAVEDVEETVFGSVKQSFSRGVVDREVGKDDGLGGIIIPGVAGSFLVMLDVFAALGRKGDDGGDEEIVSTLGAASAGGRRSRVADTEVDEIKVGVVGDRVPDGAASAQFASLPLPSLRSFLEDGRFVGLRRIPGDRVETPNHLSRVGVVGRDVATHAVLGATIADQDVSFDDTWCASDGVGEMWVNGESFPDGLSGGGIKRDEAAIERGDENFSSPNGDAAIDDVAAGVDGPLGWNLRIVRPEFFAGGGSDCEDSAPRAGEVHDSIPNDECHFITAVAVEIHIPGEGELADVLIVNLLQGTEALFAVSSPVGHPVGGFAVGVDESGGVNACRGGCFARGRWRTRFRATTSSTQKHQRAGEAEKLFAGNEISCVCWTGPRRP